MSMGIAGHYGGLSLKLYFWVIFRWVNLDLERYVTLLSSFYSDYKEKGSYILEADVKIIVLLSNLGNIEVIKLY